MFERRPLVPHPEVFWHVCSRQGVQSRRNVAQLLLGMAGPERVQLGLCRNSQPFLTHTSGPARPPEPALPSPSPARGPSLRALPSVLIEGAPPGLCGRPAGWQRRGRAVCHRAAQSASCFPVVTDAFPCSSSGSCSLLTPTGPAAWRWPSRTSCGGLGAAGELWSHCKCFSGPCCYTAPRAGTAAGTPTGHAGIRAAAVCPPRALPAPHAGPRPGSRPGGPRPSTQLRAIRGQGSGLPCLPPGGAGGGTYLRKPLTWAARSPLRSSHLEAWRPSHLASLYLLPRPQSMLWSVAEPIASSLLPPSYRGWRMPPWWPTWMVGWLFRLLHVFFFFLHK